MTNPDSSAPEQLRIVELHAENVKRLKAVDITPDGDVVVVSGRNGQGKTSVLDAIEWALAGTGAQKGSPRPIRDGEDRAEVALDLGDLRVRREWKGSKQQLTVTAADGARYPSPQRMLDDLIGQLSFDPLAFSQLSDREQRAQLLDLVELPFDPAQLDAERQAVYDERTTINRDAKRLASQLEGLPQPEPDLPVDEVAPDVVPVAEVLDTYRQVQAEHDQYRRDVEAHNAARDRVERLRAELAAAEADLEARPQPATPASDLEAARAAVDAAEETNRQAREEADELNRRIREAAEYRRQAQILDETKRAADELTERLAEIDTRKADALAAAEMPVDGLGFDESGVTYRGVPFGQCSAAERLRVSLAMAMALNPRLRVIRITDGSLLDSDNMRLIEQMAAERGFQVWIERVDESGQVGVVIEDGAVRA